MSNIKFLITLHFFFFNLVLFSCSKKSASSKEIEEYILETENGLNKESEVNGIKAQAIWRPSSLVALQDIKSREGDIDSLYESSLTKYGKNTYFIINLSGQNQDILNNDGTEDFGKKIEKISFNMSDNIFLVTPSSDTIYTGDYAFPRMYGMSKMTSLLVAFAYHMPEQAEWLDLHIKDSGLGIGNRTFRYYRKDILAVPELKLNNDI